MNQIRKNEEIKKQQLGIYIHIPFCVRKCDYCDFLSSPATKDVRKRYVNALIDEIYSYRENYLEYEVKTIFIGGGTPSVLEGIDIIRIIEALRKSFLICSQEEIEITIECNPGTVSEDKLLAYQKAGINRISFGLQSSNNKELVLLGRIHTYEEFYENYQLARRLGFQNINIDLMSALPGQKLIDWEDTLHRIMELEPEHISAYSLIIEQGTPYYDLYGEGIGKSEKNKKLLYTLPEEEEERKIYNQTQVILRSNGYHSYEISNYAKEGYECIHNSSYWRRIDYLGIGLGASSLIHNSRYHNTEDLTLYIEHSKEITSIREEYQRLSVEEQMEEFMFLGLRMRNGILKEEFYQIFEEKIDIVYGKTIEKLKKEKLISETEKRIYLTDMGIDISNYVFAEFLIL